MAYTNIKKSSDYFNTKLYTGNSSTNNITGVGFQPDWVWLKDRDSTEFHNVFDIVRGITANRLYPNSTTTTDGYDPNALQSFDSDGFTLGSGAAYNNSGNNFVAWNWLADNTSGSSNTDGSITSTVSANTTSGFSIVSYTGNGTAGATVGHGLGVAPKVVIAKSTSHTSNWAFYHYSNGAGNRLILNGNDASSSNNGYWNSTDPSSSVFTLGDEGNDTNGSGKTYIAYCFAEKKGFSKFGSYTGNGNADGTFIYTGFKPAFVIMKSSSNAVNWKIEDSKRNQPFNDGYGASINANDSSVEDNNTAYDIDLLSNGFKQRNTNSNMNNPGYTYIYMAFAEEPLVGDNPATAR